MEQEFEVSMAYNVRQARNLEGRFWLVMNRKRPNYRYPEGSRGRWLDLSEMNILRNTSWMLSLRLCDLRILMPETKSYTALALQRLADPVVLTCLATPSVITEVANSGRGVPN